MVPIYKSIIRPILDYGAVLWSPRFLKDISKVEAIQRRFTKMITGLYMFSYNDRLCVCNMHSLEVRRCRGDMIDTFKLITKKYNIEFDEFFSFPPKLLRGHKYKLYKGKARVDVRRKFFCSRVIENWNSLPVHVIEANTVNVFKNRYDAYLGSLPDTTV